MKQSVTEAERSSVAFGIFCIMNEFHCLLSGYNGGVEDKSVAIIIITIIIIIAHLAYPSDDASIAHTQKT